MPDTIPDFADRLHTPTEEEVEECKRLYMIVENARKTVLEKKTQTRRIMDLPDVATHAEEATYSEDEDFAVFRSETGAVITEARLGYEVGETRLVTTPHWRANNDNRSVRVGIWDEATDTIRYESRPGHLFGEPHWDKGDWHQIHASFLMPAWASRIAVKVTDVWVERVQEISLEDAVAEGTGSYRPPGVIVNARTEFQSLWNDLHGEDAWERNDWVECIEYELIT